MFTQAVKRKKFLRMAIIGPKGSGRTVSAIRIASAFGSVGVIDTEDRAHLIADQYQFSIVSLFDHKIESLCEVIAQSARDGIPSLVIDGITQSWTELLSEVDSLSKTLGNQRDAWVEGNKKQRLLMDWISSYPGHVICTMRSKVSWESREDQTSMISLEPHQYRGIECDFDFLLVMNNGRAQVFGPKRNGDLIERPDEIFGKELLDFLSDGVDGIPDDEMPKKLDGANSMEKFTSCLVALNKIGESQKYSKAQKLTFYKAVVDRARKLATQDELTQLESAIDQIPAYDRMCVREM